MNIKGFITNMHEYNMGNLVGEWVTFPIDEEETSEVMEEIGNPEEYFFSDWEGLNLGESISIDEVNEIAEHVETWSDELVNAVYENYSLHDLMNSTKNEWVLLPGVHNDYELGECYADGICSLYGVNDILIRYFDYEAYGRDIRLETDGCFTKYGWLERV